MRERYLHYSSPENRDLNNYILYNYVNSRSSLSLLFSPASYYCDKI
jgi:hypothetical protein